MSRSLSSGLKKAGIAGAQKHLFLCLGPDCCSPREGEKVWDFLKSETKDLHLEVMRTKVGCFRICTGGPWLVVYPEGIWYGQVTVERCRRILLEHILGGQPVTEWIVAENDLGKSTKM